VADKSVSPSSFLQCHRLLGALAGLYSRKHSRFEVLESPAYAVASCVYRRIAAECTRKTTLAVG
jgi:hypothetical protein